MQTGVVESRQIVDDLRSLDLFLPGSGGPGYVLAICQHFLRSTDDPWLPVASWVRALDAVGMPGTSARSALRRIAESGYLRRESREDVPGYGVSDALLHLLAAQTTAAPEDPRWLVVTMNVPETKRKLRGQLRTLLVRGGFGSLGNGVWLGRPHNAERALDYVEVLGSSDYIDLFVSDYLGPRPLAELVRRCWDLDAVAAGYEDCRSLALAADGSAADGRDHFATAISVAMARTAVVQLDPHLPAAALPADWPAGAVLAEVDRILAKHQAPARRWLLG